MRFKTLRIALLVAGLSPLATLQAQEAAIDTQVEIDQDAAASQERINQYDDSATEDMQAYRVALQRSESLEIYNRQLKRLIESQEKEIASITRQTEEIESIETGALPLMIQMTDTLVDIVEADVPFLIDERRDRIDNLRSLIDRADVTAGEKYRRIMEAYMVEAEYGRTIEAYRGELATDDSVRTVDFLRIGRTGLYYQTLDGSETGRWSQDAGQWAVLGSEYRGPVQEGLRVARKQAPPSLLKLPVNAPEGK